MEMYKTGNKISWLLILAQTTVIISAMSVNGTASTEGPRTWTQVAVNEAERIAAISCSGHGKAFIDALIYKNKTVQCQCNTCYEGHDCSIPSTNCFADAIVGDTMFLEDYWVKYSVSSAILISGWSRMSRYYSAPNYASLELEKYIKLLHTTVGNAVVDDKYVVFGNGVTQLINLFIRALSRKTTKTAKVVARTPYYPVFRNQTELLEGKDFEWMGNATSYANTTTPKEFIEFVTTPNNPDGHFAQEVIKGSLTIYDNVYYWPHYSPITAALDEDIMLFSMSKFTGHAGSRFGWALVRDREVYESVTQDMALLSKGSSHDSQQRTLVILKDIMNKMQKGDYNNDISYYGFRVMESRWQKLEDVVSRSDRFSLQSRPRRFCKYMKIDRPLTPGFAWLRCNYKNETQCAEVLGDGFIKSKGGVDFEAEAQYARLSLIKSEDDFLQLMARLDGLVPKK